MFEYELSKHVVNIKTMGASLNSKRVMFEYEHSKHVVNIKTMGLSLNSKRVMFENEHLKKRCQHQHNVCFIEQ